MDYSGENRFFRFSEGCCEASSGTVSVSAAADLGRRLAAHFRRFSAACDGFSHIHHLYALCSGISEAGRDVYIYENSDLPSFRFGFPLLSSDCGLFISGSSSLSVSVFGEDRMPVPADVIVELMNGSSLPPAERCGKIITAGSFRELYIANIREKTGIGERAVPASVSCGARSVRSLWNELFTGEDDELVFQVSADGQTVNAFSHEAGFISTDKLRLAFAASGYAGDCACIPENLHFQAEQCGVRLKRIAPGGFSELPADRIRYLTDPLYMCVRLAADRTSFIRTVKKLPELADSRREIIVDLMDMRPYRRRIDCCDGIVRITRSGRNRLSLIAQACSAETAAELCAEWSGKIQRMSASGGLRSDE